MHFKKSVQKVRCILLRAMEIVTFWVPKFNTVALAINLIIIPKNDGAVVML